MATPIVAQTPDELFAAAKARIEGFRTQSTKGYDDAIASTQGYAQDTAVGGNLSFMDWFNELNRNAANLDVDFAQGDLGSDFLADQDYLSRSADGALSTDLAYFEKMRLLQDDLYNQVLQEMANNKAMGLYDPPVIEEVSSSGGGGGSSGGGGGSSSSSSSNDGPYDSQTGLPLGDLTVTSQVEENITEYYPEFSETIAGLPADMRAVFQRYKLLAGPGGVPAVGQDMQQEFDKGIRAMQRLELNPEYSVEAWGETNENYIDARFFADNLVLLNDAIDIVVENHPNFSAQVISVKGQEKAIFKYKNENVVNPSSLASLEAEMAIGAEREEYTNSFASKVGDIVSNLFGNNNSEPSQPGKNPYDDPRDPRFTPKVDIMGNPMVGAGQVDNIPVSTPTPTPTPISAPISAPMPGAGDRDPRPSLPAQIPELDRSGNPLIGRGQLPPGSNLFPQSVDGTPSLDSIYDIQDIVRESAKFRLGQSNVPKNPMDDPRDPRYNPLSNTSAMGKAPREQVSIDPNIDPNIDPSINPNANPASSVSGPQGILGGFMDGLTNKPLRALSSAISEPWTSNVIDPWTNLISGGNSSQQMQAPEVQDNTAVFSQAFSQAQADKKMRDEQAVLQAAAESRAKQEEFANQASLREAAQARASANNASYNRNRNFFAENGPTPGLPTPGPGDRDPRPSNLKKKTYVPGNVR